MTFLEGTAAELGDLVDLDRGVEVLATGFTYTEGPVWDPCDDKLLFHDIPSDTRYSWSPASGVARESHPTQKANGMAIDTEGRLLICENGANRLVRREHDGTMAVLASHFEGQELNSPNDIAVHPNGDVYFSDPAYGRIPVYGQDRPQELDFQGVYRIRQADGGLDLVARDCEQPNGLCWSPDARRLYVDDCEHGSIWVYELGVDGTLGDGRILCQDVGVPCPFEAARTNKLPSGYVDGMKCDERGNIYVTGRGGVVVLDAEGGSIGVIELTEDLANLAWGGADGLDLFVCCRSFLGRVRMRVRGAAVVGPAK
jgi:gluconolactonase